ncbi:MAG: hypothetical protein ACP5PN_02650 [Steroidobacteraceae bacterium]
MLTRIDAEFATEARRAQLPVTRLANAQRWFDRVQALEVWQRTEAA